MDDDDPVKSAGREMAAAARALATGVAVPARTKAERRAEQRFEQARRLGARGRASGAWSCVERRDRPHDVEAEVAERRRRGAATGRVGPERRRALSTAADNLCPEGGFKDTQPQRWRGASERYLCTDDSAGADGGPVPPLRSPPNGLARRW